MRTKGLKTRLAGWAMGVVAACGFLGAGSAQATLLDYNVTVASSGWANNDGGPYGLPTSPTLSGVLVVNNALSGTAALESFSMATGTQAWTALNLITTAPSNAFNQTTFSSAGNLTFFEFAFQSGTGQMIISSNNTLDITDPTGASNACNGCVSFALASSPTPEPSTYLLLAAGLCLAGLTALRGRIR